MSWVHPKSSTEEVKLKKCLAHPLISIGAQQQLTQVVSGVQFGGSISAEEALPSIQRNFGALSREERKRQVLAKYRVSNDAPIISSLAAEEMSSEDRTKMRLDRLEAKEQGSAHIELIQHVEALDADLKECWGNGEKVKSLRFAIQACKLLGHSKVPACYPSIFVLGATVLDTFGDFVADRLQGMAASSSFVVAALMQRGQDAAPDLIPPEAVEVCNNWFLKISSIRELLPRIYVELSLIRCYKYVAKKVRVDMKDVVARLGRQIRGVANPLVAAHLRWYLFMRASHVLKGEGWAFILLPCCEDSLLTVEGDVDIDLLMPALQWMFDTLAKHGGEKNQGKIVSKFLKIADQKEGLHRIALIEGIVRAFSSTSLLKFVPQLNEIIEEIESLERKVSFIRALVLMLAEHPELPFPRQERTAMLSTWWEATSAIASEHPEEYLLTVGALLKFSVAHMAPKQINLLLGEMKNYVSRDDANITAEVQQAVFKALAGLLDTGDVVTLLSTDYYIPVVQWLSGEYKRQLALSILKFIPRSASTSNAVVELCRILHDGLVSQRKTDLVLMGKVSVVISRAISMAIPADAEQQLNFLCECRHSLPRLDGVKVTLVSEAIKVVHRIGHHNKKRSTAKALLSFCHVTVPAIADVFNRLQTALLCASVAFQNGFVAQGETLLQLCVSDLKEVHLLESIDDVIRSNANKIIDFVCQLLSAGFLAPPHAKYGAMYVILAVLQWASEFDWEKRSVAKAIILWNAVRGFSRIASVPEENSWIQSTPPILRQDANFLELCDIQCNTKIQDLLTELNRLCETTFPDAKAGAVDIAMDLLDHCLVGGNVENFSAAKDTVIATFALITQFGDGGSVGFVVRLQQLTQRAKKVLGNEKWQKIVDESAAYSRHELKGTTADSPKSNQGVDETEDTMIKKGSKEQLEEEEADL